MGSKGGSTQDSSSIQGDRGKEASQLSAVTHPSSESDDYRADNYHECCWEEAVGSWHITLVGTMV